VQVRGTGLARLDAAIATFNTARAQALNATGVIVAGATALDAADEACATGSRTRAAAARPAARAAGGKVRTALAALPMRVKAYDRAATDLAAAAKAATSLTDEQRAAITAVVDGGRRESAAADAFRVAGATAWPAYEEQDRVQSRWLDRAQGGWYRTEQEAADAYSVLSDDNRPALDRARTLLQRVDAARRPISEAERLALKRADAALATLRSPG
jgi:hypothetical protein